jgi:FtsZ-interacting cell division protein ZipA
VGIGAGIVLIAVGILVWMLASAAIGIILVVIGALAIVLSFAVPGPWAARGRREVIIERERPVERERVVERPATERVVERDRDVR